MQAAGTDDPDDVVSVLLDRPRVAEEREETVKIQVRVPRSLVERDRQQGRGEMVESFRVHARIIGRETLQPA